MKRLLPLLLILSLLLCACGGRAESTDPSSDLSNNTTGDSSGDPVTPPSDDPVTPPSDDPVTPPSDDPVTPPSVVYRHPLTGEVLSAPSTTRPIAVVTNNISVAQPLCGISAADVLCEIVAEGGGSITRCLAIYTDLANAGNIGSVRSARTYLVNLARSFNAPLVHCGGSNPGMALLESSGWNHLNEMVNSSYFFRNQDRLNSGYSWEHTLFTTGDKLAQAIANKGYDKGNVIDFGWQFTEDAVPAGSTANTVSLRFSSGGKYTVMNYDAADGVYYATQKWGSNTTGSFTDGNTGKNVGFENVFTLFAETTTDGYLMYADLSGTGDGYYACNGKIVPIKWSRSSDTAPFSFTLTDGTPLTLSVGKTYIGVLDIGCPFSFS